MRWLVVLAISTMACGAAAPSSPASIAGEEHGHRPSLPAHEPGDVLVPAPNSAPSEPKPVADLDVAALVEHLRALARVVQSAAGDCEALGNALVVFADRHGAEMKRLGDRLDRRGEGATDEVRQRTAPELRRIQGALLACQGNDTVAAALARLLTP